MGFNNAAKKLYERFLDFREKELERKEHYIEEIGQGKEKEKKIIRTIKDGTAFTEETVSSLHDIETEERELLERFEVEDVSSLEDFFSVLEKLHLKNMKEIQNVSVELNNNYRKPTDYHSSAPYKGLKRSVRKELYRDCLHLYEGLVYESRMIEAYFTITKTLLDEIGGFEEELTMSEKIEMKREEKKGDSTSKEVEKEEKIIQSEEHILEDVLKKLEEEIDSVETIVEDLEDKLDKNINQTSSTGADLGTVGILATAMKNENVEKLIDESLGESPKFTSIHSQMRNYLQEHGRMDNMIERLRGRLENR